MTLRKLIANISLSLIYIGGGLIFFALDVFVSWSLVYFIELLNNYTNGIVAVGILGSFIISVGVIIFTLLRKQNSK